MPTIETGQYARRRSTAAIKVDFTNEAGAAVTPDSITWSLMDQNKTIINGRSNISVSVPASTIYIVLHGDNTDFLPAEEGSDAVVRHLLVQSIYDSSYGDNLPCKDTYLFLIKELTGVPTSPSPSPSPSPSI